MLSEYGDSYPISDPDSQMISRSDMDSFATANTHQDPYGMFNYVGHPPDNRWGGSEAADGSNNYSLTMLSDGRPSNDHHLHHHYHHHFHQGLPKPSWEQHGPGHHSGHVSDEGAVSGSDGTEPDSPDRRCVKSLLHVALQKGGGFAQQFNSCGVPPVPPYPIKQEYVSSTSPISPRPLTPADSMRSYSPGYSSPVYPTALPPTPSPAYPSVITSSSSFSYAPSAPPVAPEDTVSTTSSLGYPPVGYPCNYSAFRTPFPTPSPQPSYPSSVVPLPVHLLPTMVSNFSEQTTPLSKPSTMGPKRRRGRGTFAASGSISATSASSGTVIKKRERSERQLHPCSLCEKRFKDNYSVNVHMRTHTGEKPFPCIVCGKMFRQKAHLAKHRSTHQPSEFARLENQQQNAQSNEESLDNNANSLPPWLSVPETKCKTNSLWTPSVITPPLRTVQ